MNRKTLANARKCFMSVCERFIASQNINFALRKNHRSAFLLANTIALRFIKILLKWIDY